MKTRALTWLTVLFVFMLAGCGGTAKIEKDKKVDFSQIKTFAWVDQQNSGAPRDIVERNLREAVNIELSDLNWRQDSKRPDILS